MFNSNYEDLKENQEDEDKYWAREEEIQNSLEDKYWNDKEAIWEKENIEAEILSRQYYINMYKSQEKAEYEAKVKADAQLELEIQAQAQAEAQEQAEYEAQIENELWIANYQYMILHRQRKRGSV